MQKTPGAGDVFSLADSQLVGLPVSVAQTIPSGSDTKVIDDLVNATDKYEAALAMQPEAVRHPLSDTHVGNGAGTPDRVPRRRVHQRWVYEPREASSAPNTTVVPFQKRQRKPPKRLTASRLGMIACVAASPVDTVLSTSDASSCSSEGGLPTGQDPAIPNTGVPDAPSQDSQNTALPL